MAKFLKNCAQYTLLRMIANMFAIGTTNFKGYSPRKLLSVYKIIYAASLCICYAILCFDKIKYKMYSVLATAGLLIQVHSMLLFNILLVLSTVWWQSDYYKMYEELEHIAGIFRKRLHKPCVLYRLSNFYIVAILISTPILATSDMLLEDQFISLPFWIAVHVPGITSVIYINHITALLNACTCSYDTINNYLEEFTLPHLSTMDKIYVSLENTIPHTLVNTNNGRIKANLHEIFAVRSKICLLVKNIGKLLSANLLIILFFGGIASICLTYNIFMYFVTQIQVRNTEWNTLYAQDFWAVVYILEIVAIANAVQKLKRSAGKIAVILHQLRNIYPDLDEEWVNVYSMQLLNENIAITAANLVVVDNNLLRDTIAVVATFTAVILQYDEDYLLTPPKAFLSRSNSDGNSTNS